MSRDSYSRGRGGAALLLLIAAAALVPFSPVCLKRIRPSRTMRPAQM